MNKKKILVILMKQNLNRKIARLINISDQQLPPLLPRPPSPRTAMAQTTDNQENTLAHYLGATLLHYKCITGLLSIYLEQERQCLRICRLLKLLRISVS